MAKIDCGDPSSVPCRCDPITGCGHLSSWHRVYERWMARCLVPGCECRHMDVCNCCERYDADRSDTFLRALGITQRDTSSGLG